MKKSMISVIIPTRNEENYLEKLINSIHFQKINGVEIIIADHNSKDATKSIAESYGALVVEGGNPAKGRNQGAKQSRGELLIFIDADVILPKNLLSKTLHEFKERDLDIAGTLQEPIPIEKRFKNLEYKLYYSIANQWMTLMQNTKRPYMQVCMIVKKEVYDKLGGFDESIAFGEDSELAKRAVRNGYNFGILTTPGKVFVSTRRFKKENWTLAFKYLYLNSARFFGKEFRNVSKIKYF